MRRTLTVLGLTATLLAPVPAWAQQSPAPSPSDCNGVTEIFAFPDLPAGGVGSPSTVHTIQVKGQPGTPVGVRWYSQPRPEEVYVLVEGGRIGGDGFFRSPGHRFPGNTRISATDADGPSCAPLSTLRTIRSDLAPTLVAERISPRRYIFSGSVDGVPGKVVNLYRSLFGGGGPPVLTAQTRIVNGTYRFDRTFLGSGEFNVYAVTGDDRASLGDITSFHRTVIH